MSYICEDCKQLATPTAPCACVAEELSAEHLAFRELVQG